MVPYLPHLGALLLAFAFLSWVAVSVVLRNRLSRRSQLLSAGFLALTLASAIYLDLPIDKYKRYDYIPMFLSLGGAALAAHLTQRKALLRKTNLILGLGVLLVLGTQGLLAYRWNRQWYDRLPTSTPLNYLGHERQTWFAYFRALRKAHPDTCAFVLAFDEVKYGRYQLEIPAALLSELPRAVVVGAPPNAAGWPHPLPLDAGSAAATSRQSCAWVSPVAQAILFPGQPASRP
jgi:hypothetical protein